jgi:hypothetical protein
MPSAGKNPRADFCPADGIERLPTIEELKP